MSKTNLKRIGVALGATAAALGASATSASATPLPPDGVDKYDCLIATELLDPVNPIAVAGVLCNGEEEVPPSGGQNPGDQTPDDQTPGDDSDQDGEDDSNQPGDQGPGTPDDQDPDDSNDPNQGDHDSSDGSDDQGQNSDSSDSPGEDPGNSDSSDGNNPETQMEPVASVQESGTATDGGREQLAQTGADSAALPLAVGAATMVAAGAGMIAYRRRPQA